MKERIGPLAGLLGAAGTLAGFAMSDIAALDAVSPLASAEVVAAAVASRADALQRGSGVLLAGLFLLVWFLCYLPQRLRRPGVSDLPATTAGIAGIVAVALMALVAAYVRAVTHTPISGADALIVKGVVYFDWDFLRSLAPFTSASLAGMGLAGLEARSLPRPIAWLCLAAAALPLLLPPGLSAGLYFLIVAVLSTFLVTRPTMGTPVGPGDA